MQVFIENCHSYDMTDINNALSKHIATFKNMIKKGNSVTIKPNWISHSHKYNESEWESVITHPNVITAVLDIVLACLSHEGKVVIADGPQTSSSWEMIMQRMHPELWIKMGRENGVDVSIIDLREDMWITRGDITIERKKLPGDPLGSTECNLGNHSEFTNHKVSPRGYFGADYNKEETNQAHSGSNHKYRVSRTVMESDVFINVPKMKTHKKAGITCSLKNLVGINTYKNWLPHHNEGTPDEGGDQFPQKNLKTKSEGVLLDKFTSFLSNYPYLGIFLIPIKKLGKILFGSTRTTVRSGSWYGNDTLWRTVLDLNKILFYVHPDGSLRPHDVKAPMKYLSVVDGIIAGEGSGPEAPDPKHTGLLIIGTNPVAVDAVCAKIMGFDWQKIPSIKNAFYINHYPLCDFFYDEIEVISSNTHLNKCLTDIDPADTFHFKPHFGWKNHIEL
jgi:uncharacterized protein (DUF362 family)